MGAISSMSAVLILVARSDWWESLSTVSVILVFLSVFVLSLRSAFAGAVVFVAIIESPPSLEPVGRRYGRRGGSAQLPRGRAGCGARSPVPGAYKARVKVA